MLGHIEPKFGNLADFTTFSKNVEKYIKIQDSEKIATPSQSLIAAIAFGQCTQKNLGTLDGGLYCIKL
jgi:hypothetical protein